MDEHCRTQRLNFLFFLLRSSLSVHVAMKTGSSSIRGSCSTCNWIEKRRKKETKEFMIAEILQANTILVLCLCTSLPYKDAKFLLFSAATQQKNKAWPSTLCCGWLLYKCLLPLTISYSSIALRIEAVLRVGRLLVACCSKLYHQLNLVCLNVFHPSTPYNML